MTVQPVLITMIQLIIYKKLNLLKFEVTHFNANINK